jgi:anti-anti-sigma regulatory factor
MEIRFSCNLQEFPVGEFQLNVYLLRNRQFLLWHDTCLFLGDCGPRKEDRMFSVHVEKIGDVAVILCEGRMIGSDAAFKLRDEVRRQRDSNVVLLDLSELGLLGGDVLGMLVFLQAWTRGLGIRFKLFDPPPGVRRSLERLRSTAEFEIAAMDDVLSMLHWEGPRNRVAGLEAEVRGSKAA